jgi:hypothetical protein
MNIMGNVGKAIGGVGRILIPPKRPKRDKQPVSKNFIQETPEEYANRLVQRKNRRY